MAKTKAKKKVVEKKEARTVVADGRGALAGKEIGRPPAGTAPCFKCKDLDPEGNEDPLITKFKCVKKYGPGIASPEFAEAAGHAEDSEDFHDNLREKDPEG